jgi:phosphoglycolate phosphatase
VITTIIWDWNGTLLDDVDPCVATLNVLRARRSLAALSRDEYRALFGFPVRAFYESIGFAFALDDDYSALSRDFIAEYRRRAPEMRVSEAARGALERLAARGIQHVVVSAMEMRLLGEMLAEHALTSYLRGYFGTRDHTAGSKVAIGAAAAADGGLDPKNVLVVGDTLHDLELAQAIGCRALLYAGGHQDRRRLEGAGVPVIESFAELDAHVERELEGELEREFAAG